MDELDLEELKKHLLEYKSVDCPHGQRADEYDSDVFVEHRDGTKMEFKNARIVRIDSEWVSIHTEHCGFHVFHIGDLIRLRSITEEEWVVGDALEDE